MKNTIQADFKNKTWKRSKKKKAAIEPKYEKLTIEEMRENLAGSAEKEQRLADDRANGNDSTKRSYKLK